MRTSSAKAKGRRAAAEMRDLLLKQAPTLQEGDIQVTPSGVPGVDLHLSPLARSIYPFAIEMKNQEALNVWAALQQAESHRQPGLIPILGFRRNRSQLYIALRADEFLRLVRRE